jgi:G:T-mismatch repair DNA endonuclease (very short patch repair protein)
VRKNKERDRRNRLALNRLGWKALVIWQCQMKLEGKLLTRLREFFV